MADLRDKYVEYEAKTVVFRGTCGGGPTDEDNETGTVVQDSPPESIVLERVKTFADEMLGRDKEINGGTVTPPVRDRRNIQKM